MSTQTFQPETSRVAVMPIGRNDFQALFDMPCGVMRVSTEQRLGGALEIESLGERRTITLEQISAALHLPSGLRAFALYDAPEWDGVMLCIEGAMLPERSQGMAAPHLMAHYAVHTEGMYSTAYLAKLTMWARERTAGEELTIWEMGA